MQHKQETRFQSSSMEDGAMKYYSASDRRPGEGVQGGGNDCYFSYRVEQKICVFSSLQIV